MRMENMRNASGNQFAHTTIQPQRYGRTFRNFSRYFKNGILRVLNFYQGVFIFILLSVDITGALAILYQRVAILLLLTTGFVGAFADLLLIVRCRGRNKMQSHLHKHLRPKKGSGHAVGNTATTDIVLRPNKASPLSQKTKSQPNPTDLGTHLKQGRCQSS
jgi:hypothetical protein